MGFKAEMPSRALLIGQDLCVDFFFVFFYRAKSNTAANSMKYGSQRYMSPKKTGYQTTRKGSNSSSIRRELSLTSISSNSSASSTSTMSSIQSDL